MDIPWDLYRSMLAVMREGSLSGAARSLGVTQPTIGRHIDQLERSIAIPLFIRTHDGLIPTETALSLRLHIEQMESSASALIRQTKRNENQVKGSVRITASEIISIEVLPKIMAQISAKHPALQLELSVSNRVQDLLHREADIAVRMFRPEQTQLIAKQIDTVSVGLFAHQSYLEQAGKPLRFDDLKQHRLIGYDSPTTFVREMLKGLPTLFERDSFAICANNDLAQLALIRAGAGIGACQAALARQDSQLVQLLSDQFEYQMTLWMTMHEDLRNNLACMTVFKALSTGLAKYLQPSRPKPISGKQLNC